MLKMAVRFERLVTQGDDAELGKAAFLLGGGQDNDTERELWLLIGLGGLGNICFFCASLFS